MGATVALAGTASGVGKTGSPDVDASGAITGVTFDGGDLYVRVNDTAAADYVVLIDPNGQQFGESALRRGETAGKFTVFPTGFGSGDAYSAGTYTAHAYENQSDGEDSEVGTAEITMEPELEIAGFEARGKGWPRLLVTNSGSGPARARTVRIRSGVPHPDDEDDGAFEEDFVVDPGETRFFEYYEGGYHSPVHDGNEGALSGLCGTTREVEFDVQTKSFGTFTSTLELTYGDLREETGSLSGPEYYCASITGGEEI